MMCGLPFAGGFVALFPLSRPALPVGMAAPQVLPYGFTLVLPASATLHAYKTFVLQLQSPPTDKTVG